MRWGGNFPFFSVSAQEDQLKVGGVNRCSSRGLVIRKFELGGLFAKVPLG